MSVDGMDMDRRPSMQSSDESSSTMDSVLSSQSAAMQFTPASSVNDSPHLMQYATNGDSRTFPAWVLGLLLALETDPQHASNLLQSNACPSSFSTYNALDTPAETDAIYSSFKRIAAKLASAPDEPLNSGTKATFSTDAVSSLVQGNGASLKRAAFTSPQDKPVSLGPYHAGVKRTHSTVSYGAGSPPVEMTAAEELHQLKSQVQVRGEHRLL
jgi:hypothetical protein